MLADTVISMHRAWVNWLKVRKSVYERLGIKNTEDLISAIKSHKITADMFIDIINKLGINSEEKERLLLREYSKQRIRLISIFDKDYPQELLNMQKINNKIYPPLLLYILQESESSIDFNERPIVSIVGTRKCTIKGAEIAYDIASALARHHNFIIATGLAQGIDHHATQGALDHNGTIIEVRPYLFPVDYVKKEDYERILKHGCILSENLNKLPNPSWIRMNLYLRNRIITGISKAVIVVEARARKSSGSMHQIEFALKRNKPVLIWKPASYDDELIKGFNEYRDRGAKEFKDVDDLIELLKEIIKKEQPHHQHPFQQRIDTPY